MVVFLGLCGLLVTLAYNFVLADTYDAARPRKQSSSGPRCSGGCI
jgi:hypothetical protein